LLFGQQSAIETVSVALSATGLTNIVLNSSEKDFTFYIGEYHSACPTFIAEFLSPRLCGVRLSDSTICEYHFGTADRSDYFEHSFRLVLVNR
jgi:hypothetical protein